MSKKWILLFLLLIGAATHADEKPNIPEPFTAWSPWLKFHGQPPENGAIGVLNMPGPERQDIPPYSIFVYWTAFKKSESVPSGAFLWAKDCYKGINSGEQCLQMQLLVFDMQGEWALLYGRNGCAWTSIRQKIFDRRICWDEERISLLESHLRDHMWKPDRESLESAGIPNRKGYTLSSYEEFWQGFIQLPPGPLRAAPRDDARLVGRLPDRWTWQHLAKPIEKWPLELSQLELLDEPYQMVQEEGGMAAVPLRVLEMKGDWLRVQLPKAGTIFYYAEGGWEDGPLAGSMVACWDKEHIGWVRWRSHGPLPGTFKHLIISVNDQKGME